MHGKVSAVIVTLQEFSQLVVSSEKILKSITSGSRERERKESVCVWTESYVVQIKWLFSQIKHFLLKLTLMKQREEGIAL